MPHELSYSRFMHGLGGAGITLDRKALSELAIHDPQAFGSLVEKARAALGS
jgi:large subunit ribosomal protein L20